jgi:DNA-binding response OmpR family regulator
MCFAGFRGVDVRNQPAAVPCVLVVISSTTDRWSLQRTLIDGGWNLAVAETVDEVRAALQEGPSIAVVMSGTQLSDGASWKDLLRAIQAVPIPPELIVTAALADEHLWGEVLNLGGHDLLATPFDAKEVSTATWPTALAT